MTTASSSDDRARGAIGGCIPRGKSPLENVPATPLALTPTLCHNNTYCATASSNGGRAGGGAYAPQFLDPNIYPISILLLIENMVLPYSSWSEYHVTFDLHPPPPTQDAYSYATMQCISGQLIRIGVSYLVSNVSGIAREFPGGGAIHSLGQEFQNLQFSIQKCMLLTLNTITNLDRF